MNHKIVSFYKNNLDNEVVSAQKKVFNKFNIPLIQIPFQYTHHQAIEEFINSISFDCLSIIDVDLIPLKHDVFTVAFNKINNKNVIYGNAQSSNSYAYAGPNFLNFSKETYKKVNYTSFCNSIYEGKEADVAEMFSINAAKAGVVLELSYPTHIIEPLWECKLGKTFKFGIGTTYDSNTFHCYQIREPGRKQIFLNKCNEIISV